jgi:hypothetical protein
MGSTPEELPFPAVYRVRQNDRGELHVERIVSCPECNRDIRTDPFDRFAECKRCATRVNLPIAYDGSA